MNAFIAHLNHILHRARAVIERTRPELSATEKERFCFAVVYVVTGVLLDANPPIMAAGLVWGQRGLSLAEALEVLCAPDSPLFT